MRRPYGTFQTPSLQGNALLFEEGSSIKLNKPVPLFP